VLAELLAEPAQLLPARTQMAFTLGFHIILVPFGVAFTFITLVAHWRGLKKGDADALRLAQRWSKVAAVLFAVGAVSGTVLTFEMGLLWPGLMGPFGDAYGIPFAVEGLFFFLEAIFLAIYIYGWKRMPAWPHWWTGVPVVISGMGGTLSVVAANGWMNQPGGFKLRNGEVTDVEPLKVFFNDAFWHESIHMLIAAYLVAGFVVAGVYAAAMLRGRRDRYFRLGFLIPFTVAAMAVPAQFVVGDWAARQVFQTGPDQPEVLGGLLIDGDVKFGVEIPGLASFLADYSTDTVIKGLSSVPPRDRPAANVVHLAFDAMVGIATALLALVGWFAFVWWRRRELPTSRWFLRAASVAGVASVVAMEAGWVVTEVGRQPWVIQDVLRTEDAVTRSDGVWVTLTVTVLLYVAVGTAAVLVLRGMSSRWRKQDEAEPEVPYGPRDPFEEQQPEPVRA
jgi:cytochrome d ubiquinol oxidase subunit I